MNKIGSWNKQVDRAVLVFQLLLLVAFFLTAFSVNAVALLLIYLVIALGHTIRLIKSNYVSYNRGTFIIDGPFRSRRVINASLFDGGADRLLHCRCQTRLFCILEPVMK